jgi:hypothetical protein
MKWFHFNSKSNGTAIKQLYEREETEVVKYLQSKNSASILIIKILLMLVAVLPSMVFAQNVSTDCQDSLNYRINDSYLQRVQNYKNFWDKIIPKYTKLQFAGGMGVISAGWGWDYGKHRQWETDMFFGYLPKYSTKRPKLTFTLKQNYIPWSIPIKSSMFSFEPLTCGLYINTIFDDDFWTSEPARYPKGYYGFSPRLRPFIFLGEKFTFYIKPNRFRRHRSISFYYELSSCDIYIISAVKNSSIHLDDIIKLSFGMKFQIL